MKRLLGLMLCIALLLCTVTAAQAAAMLKDGMEITLEADQQEYNAGETVEVTLTVKNAGERRVHLSSVQWEVPECLTAIQEKSGFAETTLAQNDLHTQTMAFRITKAAAPALPQTGDDSALLLWGALAVLSIAGFVCLKPSVRRRLLALVLCVLLLGSMVPEMSMAKAEEADGASAEKAIRRLVISEGIEAAGESVRISAVLEYLPEENPDGKVTLTVPKGITQRTTATGNVNLSWNAVANADGYEISMMTPNRDYYKLYGRSLSTNLTLKGLNAEFTWYKVKIRAFRLVNGVRTYGPYSSVFTGNPVSVRRLYVHEEYFNGAAKPIPTATEDVALLREIFQMASPFARRPIVTNRYVNLSKSALKTRIAEMAALTDHNDVTIVYLSTQGDASVTSGVNAGRLTLSDGSKMTFQELAAELKKISGRVVVMLNSNGSGSAINKSADQTSALIKAIAEVDEKLPADGDTILEKTGELQLDKFYVIAAAAGGANNQFDAIASYLPQYMEAAFLRNASGKWQGDANGDNTITLGELESFMQAYAARLQSENGGYYMSPQVYPTNSTFPIFRGRSLTAGATSFTAAHASLTNGTLKIPGTDGAGAAYQLSITSSHPWTVEMDDLTGSEWIALDKTSGAKGSSKLTVTLKKLPPVGSTYKTKLTFTCNETTYIYYVQMTAEEIEFEYSIASAKVTITKYLGSKANVTVPDTIEGCPVTAIGADAFKNCLTLESINLPDSITVIGARAFSGCTNLKSMD